MTPLDLATPEALEALGALLARHCPRPAVIFLEGDLGAGKTTLARGFLRALGHRGAVRSPTYTLLEPYEPADGPIFHLDLYRLADPEELAYLGLRDLVGERAILLVEWPERGQGGLPPADLRIRIAHRGGGRRIHLEPISPAGCLLAGEVTGAGSSGDLPTKRDMSR